MKKVISYIFISAALLVNVHAAGSAAPGVKRGGICIGSLIAADSIFGFEYIGKVTIQQIYEKGFRVVHMQEDKRSSTYVTLVIEEQ